MKGALVFVTILSVVICCSASRSLDKNCRFEDPEKRLNAGVKGISQMDCESNGNCFDDTIPGVNWCFRQNLGRTQKKNCNFAYPKDRIDGGFPGITKAQCEAMGYCFDDTMPGVNYCFKRKCDFAARQDGGWAGISRKECENLGNCFDDSAPGTIFCYLPR